VCINWAVTRGEAEEARPRGAPTAWRSALGHRQHLAFAAGEFAACCFVAREYRKLFVLFIETLLQVDLGHHRAESKILLHGEFTDDAAPSGT